MSLIKKFFALVGCLLILYPIGNKIVSRQTHSFSLQNIQPRPPSFIQKSGKDAALNHLVKNKRFKYLGFGSESVVFLSEDKRHVLKFLKKHRIESPSFFNYLSFIPYFKTQIDLRNKRHLSLWKSLHLQMTQLKDETGLVYFHLPDSTSDIPVEIIDAIGCKRLMNLKSVPFVFQKRCHLFKESYLSEPDLDKRKNLIFQLLNFYQKIDQKGLYIWDDSVTKNFGVIEDEVFLIDAGALAQKNHNQTNTHPKGLVIWLKKYDPQMLKLIDTHKL